MATVINDSDSTEIVIGAHVTDSLGHNWIYRGIARMPTAHGNTGGYFPGRLIMVNAINEIDRKEFYPYEFGLRIVVD